MQTTLRILHLEDDPYDAELAEELLLADGILCEVWRVDSREEFGSALADRQHDIILADNSMPGFDGMSALALAREKAPDVPFIFVSGTLGEELAIESLKSGAVDYVLKQRLARLVPVVRRALEREQERRERQRAQDALRQSERQMRALVTSLDDIVFEIDERGIYLNVWAADEGLLSRPTEELIGRRIDETIAAELAISFQESIMRALASGQAEDIEYPLEVIEGRRWFLARISPIPSAEGSHRTVCMLVRDITERKQAEEEIRQRVAHQSALNAIITAASQAGASLKELLEVALDQTLRAFGLEMGMIWIDAGEYTTRGLSSDFATTIRDLTQAQGFIIDSTTATPDWQKIPGVDPRTAIAGLMASSSVSADIVTPLWRGDERLGGLSIMASQPREWFGGDIVLWEALCRQLATPPYRARLLENTQTRLEHLTALRAIDIAISSSLDLQLILNVILDQITTQLRVDACDLLLVNQYTQVLEYKAGIGFRNRAVEGTRVRVGEGLAGLAALERRTISFHDKIQEDQFFVRQSLVAAEQFVAYYAVPFLVKGHVKGVLEIFNRTPLDPDQEWLDFLDALAGQTAIAIDNTELFQDLQRSNIELALAYDATIEGWSRALDLRDRETEGHTRRVTELTERLARVMRIGEEELVHIRRGSLLHDIGKMGVPDSILLKPGPLTEEEWVIMRRHPVYVFEMLSRIDYLRPALEIPYCHHEKWDGTGYPRGLKGESIPLVARIFAVVDVWDALHSDRPYRAAWPEDRVRAYIREQAGIHFDPKVVETFLSTLASEGNNRHPVDL